MVTYTPFLSLKSRMPPPTVKGTKTFSDVRWRTWKQSAITWEIHIYENLLVKKTALHSSLKKCFNLFSPPTWAYHPMESLWNLWCWEMPPVHHKNDNDPTASCMLVQRQWYHMYMQRCLGLCMHRNAWTRVKERQCCYGAHLCVRSHVDGEHWGGEGKKEGAGEREKKGERKREERFMQSSRCANA